MFNNVESLLIKCLSEGERRVVIGVSGGPDSLVLLDVLHKLQVSLIVAHVHHGLRQAADEDLLFVESEAEKRGLPFFAKRVNVPALAQKTGKSIEETGRMARYHFLFALALEHQAQAVAVAHTADDQVETILMHLLRGSGLEGLRGMQPCWLPNPWSTQIPLLRPLLNAWRNEILEYCAENGLNPIEDASNQDSTYFRNRLRNELIPYLSTYNPQIKQTIWKLGSVVTEDYHLLQPIYQQGWSTTVLQTAENFIKINRTKFREQPIAVQRMILRNAARQLNEDIRDIGFDLLERALQFSCSNRTSGKIQLGMGLDLVLLEHELWLQAGGFSASNTGWPFMESDIEFKLPTHGEIQISAGWRLAAEWLEKQPEAIETVGQNPDPYQAFLQPGDRAVSFVIRSRRSGDRLRPLGMGGRSQKLSDYMVNVKLPRMARKTWPLVSTNNEVVWLPGYTINHEFRVNNITARILHLVLTQTSQADAGSDSL
jgi:tRNA(Ile)-lysidine synthase